MDFFKNSHLDQTMVVSNMLLQHFWEAPCKPERLYESRISDDVVAAAAKKGWSNSCRLHHIFMTSSWVVDSCYLLQCYVGAIVTMWLKCNKWNYEFYHFSTISIDEYKYLAFLPFNWDSHYFVIVPASIADINWPIRLGKGVSLCRCFHGNLCGITCTVEIGIIHSW